MRLLVLVAAACFALALSLGAAAQEFSSLEERMSDAEFRAAGLDRLTPEELEQLNQWLRTRIGDVPTTAAPGGEMGFKSSSLFGEGDRTEIVSSIDGEFDGWAEGTVIKLQNGQWWEVSEPQEFDVAVMQSPSVTIKPKLMGSWLMQVEGYNRSVRVTRIR